MPYYTVESHNSLTGLKESSADRLRIIKKKVIVNLKTSIKLLENDNSVIIDLRGIDYIELTTIKSIKRVSKKFTHSGKKVTILCWNQIGYRHICRLLHLFRNEYDEMTSYKFN